MLNRGLLPALVVLISAACYPNPQIDPRQAAEDKDKDGHSYLVDCNDEDASIFPGADEYCDGVDNDCDQMVDEADALDTKVWYVDGDGDGFGDDAVSRRACEAPESYVDNVDDCDDSIATVYPDADELCDSLDNDCDGDIDEDPVDAIQLYWDFDADGFGDPTAPVRVCEPKSWLVEDNRDCNDRDATINPVARETCDTIDNDCDTLIDDEDDTVDPESFSAWYPDSDGDGFGAYGAEATLACDGGEGYVLSTGDCDDDNPDDVRDCTPPEDSKR